MRRTTRFAKLDCFLRSAGVGVAASLADLLVLALLVEGLGRSPAIANVPALLIGLSVQFWGNKVFAFRDRSRELLRQGVRFAAVEAGAFALNGLLFHAAVAWLHTPYAPARIASSALVYVAYSFPLWRLVFRPGQAVAGPRVTEGHA